MIHRRNLGAVSKFLASKVDVTGGGSSDNNYNNNNSYGNQNQSNGFTDDMVVVGSS